jgi:hypothetical protein
VLPTTSTVFYFSFATEMFVHNSYFVKKENVLMRAICSKRRVLFLHSAQQDEVTTSQSVSLGVESRLGLKVKGHLWVLQHLCLEGVLYSYPNEFLHSSPEALHTKRRERPLLAKEGTISEFS